MKCTYLVARGTLDEVLWKLIEKKFRDLGEFVEGKERHKLVVDHVYENNAELMASIFDFPLNEETDGDEFADANPMEDLQLSFQDIAELGAEERRMLMVDGEDGEQAVDQMAEGKTEVSPITLLDDDETDQKPAAEDNTINENGRARNDEERGDGLAETPNASKDESKVATVSTIPENSLLYGCRLYKVIFTTSRLGLSVKLHYGRVFIYRILPERREALGENSKPDVGDILVSVGGYPLPLHDNIDYILNFTKYFLRNPPVELQFVEAPRATVQFLNSIESQVTIARSPTTNQSNQVIEILDDD